MGKPDEDTSTYPALGRALMWVDRPGNGTKIFWGLVVACVVVLGLGFTYEPHGELSVEHYGWFYAFYGFASFVVLVAASSLLKRFASRDEMYYGDKITDPEDYPEDQLERLSHDD